MIQRISIDGACRRNGKPDCVSAGGVFIQLFSDDLELLKTTLLSNYEVNSTNQRGEMLALLTSLGQVYANKIATQIVTDSEYLFNAMTKDWLSTWSFKGWQTASGENVKNKDIWQLIQHSAKTCSDAGIEINYYHIKGHCIPFGKVTAQTALAKDDTGRVLFDLVTTKFREVYASGTKADVIRNAQELSAKNNGFCMDAELLEAFVVSNIVADAVATRCVESADAL